MPTKIWVNIGSGNRMGITRRHVNLLSKVFRVIRMKAVSQWVLMNLIRNNCSDITLLFSRYNKTVVRISRDTGLVLGLCPANERRRYKVKPSLIGWAQTRISIPAEIWTSNQVRYQSILSSQQREMLSKNYLSKPTQIKRQNKSKFYWLIVAKWSHMVTYIWVLVGSDNGLLFDGIKA